MQPPEAQRQADGGLFAWFDHKVTTTWEPSQAWARWFWGGRKAATGAPSDREAREEALRHVLAGLAVAVMGRPDCVVRINTTGRYYATERRHPAWTWQVWNSLKALREAGLLIHAADAYRVKPAWGSGSAMRIPAGYVVAPSLLSALPPPPAVIPRTDFSLVLVRESDKRLANIAPHPESARWATLLASHRDLMGRVRAECAENGPLHSSGFTLSRIFSRGSYELGGRLYAIASGTPGELRRRWTFDGEPVVEVDYCTLHPAILYARAGKPCPPDPYAMMGLADRDAGKQAFNSLVNAGASVGKQEPGQWVRVRQAHPDLEAFFRTGEGLRLQRTDSEMAMAVLTCLVPRGIPVVPFHDSFIVSRRHMPDLLEGMRMGRDRLQELEGRAVPLDIKADGARWAL